jgi:hypothetical protein
VFKAVYRTRAKNLQRERMREGEEEGERERERENGDEGDIEKMGEKEDGGWHEGRGGGVGGLVMARTGACTSLNKSISTTPATKRICGMTGYCRVRLRDDTHSTQRTAPTSP